jgi:hypothetical protein
MENRKITIKNREGIVIFESITANLKSDDLKSDDLENANLEYANLEYADLENANLKNANLKNANLRAAYIEGANLKDANLKNANLEGADLENTDLRNANLKNANLDNTFLRNANLKNANLDYQIQEGLLSKIAEIVLNDNNSLNMRLWHTCDTVHCLAGWACHLNSVAKKLEEEIGTANAALLTLGAEAHSYFYKTDKEGIIDFLKKQIK